MAPDNPGSRERGLSVIVSGDHDLFSLVHVGQINILAPSEFLESLNRGT